MPGYPGASRAFAIRKLLTLVPPKSGPLFVSITAVKIYKSIQLFGDSAVPHRDLSNYVG